MDIATLASDNATIAKCPTFVVGPDDLPMPCDAPLHVTLTREVIGDDYGSWSTYSVGFECGHSFADMESSLRHADEI